jgi:hypothetical protein
MIKPERCLGTCAWMFLLEVDAGEGEAGQRRVLPRLLPNHPGVWALVLGVEQSWGEPFAAALWHRLGSASAAWRTIWPSQAVPQLKSWIRA